MSVRDGTPHFARPLYAPSEGKTYTGGRSAWEKIRSRGQLPRKPPIESQPRTSQPPPPPDWKQRVKVAEAARARTLDRSSRYPNGPRDKAPRRPPPVKRRCLHCNGLFTPDHNAIKICSDECRRLRGLELMRINGKRQRERERDRRRMVRRTCKVCGNPFSPYVDGGKETVCSELCAKRNRNERMRGVNRAARARRKAEVPTCPECGDDLENAGGGVKTCSPACAMAWARRVLERYERKHGPIPTPGAGTGER